ncbi:hypothetical protein DE146DRAFT_778966 [Phaeosphaeria sp. MPI-PUGE-AT-0046c]|nr:hypothetical protein DE146DRAFT_778966 [Phaeosphaeria sp. MPI-PUGE-AT-0046c]
MSQRPNAFHFIWALISAISFFLMLLLLPNIRVEYHYEPTTPLSSQKPPSIHPLVAIEPPLMEQPSTPGVSVISITYGPYDIAPQSMRPQEVVFNVRKPCTNCYIVAMHALLEDVDGTEIFTDSGVWLHHIIFFNTGRTDLVCPQMAGERFFGGGNERWTRRWNSIGPWGYKIDEDDAWDIVVELMNDADVEKAVNIIVRYEIIEADSEIGKDYRGIAAVWLDLTGCGSADMDVKSTTESFYYRTPDWTSPVNGTMVDVGGHMHDGGLNMTMYMNGDPLCVSTQLYDNQAAEQHIVAAGICKDTGRVKDGDVLWADAKYDPNIHPLIIHGGKPDPVMGSMGVYIALD